MTLPSPCGRLVRQGVRSHYRKDSAQTTRRKGLPISTPEQTFLDLAAIGVGLVDLAVVADGLIKAAHTSPELLIEVVTSDGIYREPLRTLERYAPRYLTVEPSGSVTFRPEWRIHFPND